MNFKSLFLIAAVAMFVNGHVNAVVFYNAGEMLEFCESESEDPNSNCVLFLTGIVESHNVLSEWDQLASKYLCVPEGVTQGQLQKIYIKYANERPETLHLSAGGFALNAFNEAFPCK